MSNRWASGIIAGVALNDAGGRPLRIDVLDAEPMKSLMVGNAQESLDLTVHTQILVRGLAAIHFGIHIAQAPASILQTMVDAIEDAVSGGDSFNVSMADDSSVDNFNVACVPDYAAMEGRLYKRGGMAAGYVKDFVMRFITIGEAI